MNAMPEPHQSTPTRKRSQKTVSVAVLMAHQKRLDLNNAQFMEAIGYSAESNMTSWMRAGRAPQVAALAAEALVRRQAPNQAQPDRTFIMTIIKGVVTFTELTEDLHKVTLDGTAYYLVPLRAPKAPGL